MRKREKKSIRIKEEKKEKKRTPRPPEKNKKKIDKIKKTKNKKKTDFSTYVLAVVTLLIVRKGHFLLTITYRVAGTVFCSLLVLIVRIDS